MMNCSAYKSQAFAEADAARALLNFPPSTFGSFFIQDDSRLQLCPSVPCCSLPVSVKTAKNGPVKSRTAVIKEAFGIYECRGFALWMMSSRLQLPVRVVNVKQIICGKF